MTRDDILRLMREAAAQHGHTVKETTEIVEFCTSFAALVAAHEREECAKVCDDKVDAEYTTGKVDHNEMGWTQSCAAAIRARG